MEKIQKSRYSSFHTKGTWSVHSFNGVYLSIPEGIGSYGYLFHEIPGSLEKFNLEYSNSILFIAIINLVVSFLLVLKVLMIGSHAWNLTIRKLTFRTCHRLFKKARETSMTPPPTILKYIYIYCVKIKSINSFAPCIVHFQE